MTRWSAVTGRAHCQRQVAFFKFQVEQARSFFFGGVYAALDVLYHLTPIARPQTHYNRPHATASGLI